MTNTTNDAHERFDTVIIGAGQAGLSTAYHLQQSGQKCVVLDAHQRVGDSWRKHWDTLKLYSPAKYDGLPGMPFPGDRWAYPGKDDVADYLHSYAEHFELPVRNGVRVERVTRNGAGFVVHVGDQVFRAANVVVASGAYGGPNLPAAAAQLDVGIRQLHSSEYRRPGQLADGPVLVVGAAHSGADIAVEVAATHETVLCGRDTGQMPIKIPADRAPAMTRAMMPLMWFAWNKVLTTSTPAGRKMKPLIRNHGGPLLRVKRADLAKAGVERVFARVSGASGGKPMLDDGRVLDVANVIWCTGYKHTLDWIESLTHNEDGYPCERRGVAIDLPGLYFVGLKFQRSFASMLVGGVGTDAAYVAKHIASRRRGLAAENLAAARAAAQTAG